MKTTLDIDGIKIGEVLRNAYDDFWTKNPPTHEHGTPGYYEWYKEQNEFVAKSLLDAIQAPANQSTQELNEIKFRLSRREALSHWNADVDKIRAMLAVLEKLDPLGDAMREHAKTATTCR